MKSICGKGTDKSVEYQMCLSLYVSKYFFGKKKEKHAISLQLVCDGAIEGGERKDENYPNSKRTIQLKIGINKNMENEGSAQRCNGLRR